MRIVKISTGTMVLLMMVICGCGKNYSGTYRGTQTSRGDAPTSPNGQSSAQTSQSGVVQLTVNDYGSSDLVNGTYTSTEGLHVTNGTFTARATSTGLDQLTLTGTMNMPSNYYNYGGYFPQPPGTGPGAYSPGPYNSALQVSCSVTYSGSLAAKDKNNRLEGLLIGPSSPCNTPTVINISVAK